MWAAVPTADIHILVSVLAEGLLSHEEVPAPDPPVG